MKALKIALESLNNANPYEGIEQSIASLEELASYAENNSSETSGVSMESVFKSFREPNFLEFGQAQKASLALEELSLGVWAAIAAIAAAVVIALKKFFDWAFGGSKSSGGAVTSSVDKVSTNKELFKKHGIEFKQLEASIKDGEVTFEEVINDHEKKATDSKGNVAKEEMATDVHALVGNRKYIESMEDVLALQLKDFTEADQSWRFIMVSHDGFSDDILNKGPYSQMVGDLVKIIENGQYSKARTKALQDELEALVKAGDKSSPEAFEEFSKKLGDTDNIHVGGLGAAYRTVSDLIAGSKKYHSELVEKKIEGRLKMVEVHHKLEQQLEGSTMAQMSKASESIKETVKVSEEHYNNFKIEADVNAHNERVTEKEGNSDKAAHHRAVSGAMRHMSQMTKHLCEMARILFVWSKAVLRIMEYLRSASYTALKLLNQSVLPRVKNEDSKKRITDMGKELRAVLAEYTF